MYNAINQYTALMKKGKSCRGIKPEDSCRAIKTEDTCSEKESKRTAVVT
jgi:hypothetical protein